jgi:hypothetical protein
MIHRWGWTATLNADGTTTRSLGVLRLAREQE